jgi:DNA-binding FadR family transcriptional regulator
MVTTTRGVHGGSAVARIEHRDVTEMLQESIILLSHGEGATVDEILETRDLLEVPAARLAARRRTPEQLELLRNTIPFSLEDVELEQIFEVNRSFHDVLLATAGNRMLSVVTEPMFKVMQTRFLRDRADLAFWRQVMAEHAAIFAAVEAGDAERAGAEMAQHLTHLRATYLSIDRHACG